MAEHSASELAIRDYLPSDARALTDIFHDTIHTVGLERYTEAQVRTWAPLPIDYPHWQERLEAIPPFAAELEGTVVGFITLEPDGHIHWTYTHQDYERRGVAGALFKHLEAHAHAAAMPRLYLEASRFARPFFEGCGFTVLSEEQAERGGQQLRYWAMEKILKR